jgi:thiamine-phosphate pyrophosphorylase
MRLEFTLNILTGNRRKLNFPLSKNTPSLPLLFAFSDEARDPDPLVLIKHVPEGCGYIFRHYLLPDRGRLALQVVKACRKRNLLCFIAGDLQLCMRTNADGIHLPEHLLRRPTYGLSHFKQRGGLVTAATHSLSAGLIAQKYGVDGIFISPVFATKSHVGSTHLGLMRFAQITQHLRIPVFALGGTDLSQTTRLKKSGAYGLGGISLFK